MNIDLLPTAELDADADVDDVDDNGRSLTSIESMVISLFSRSSERREIDENVAV
jgi:hypothetical protein